MPSPAATIDYEKPSFLVNNTFGEVIHPKCIDALLASEFLQESYDINNYSAKLASLYYKNEKEQLIAYMKLYRKKELLIPVKYGLPRHKLGRVTPFKALGLTSLSKRVRNTLIQHHYVDLDLANAQPKILFDICKANDMESVCDFLSQLVHNRNEILQDVMTAYSVSRKKAKELFLRLAFYGTFKGWCIENGLNEDFKPNDFIKGLSIELQTIASIIQKKNKALYEKVRKLNKDKENITGSFMAFYLQTYELQILSVMCEYLCNHTKLCDVVSSKLKILTYEFDGIKLLKEGVSSYGIERLCRELEDVVLQQTGFNIVLEQKPIEDIHEVEFDDSLDVVDDSKSYEVMKTQFELQHCKIINCNMFIKKDNDKIITMTRSHLTTAYEHLKYEKPKIDKDGNVVGIIKVSFIHDWLDDDKMRVFEDIGVYPKSNLCPSNIFNMWIPFEMEKYTDEYTKHNDALEFILNHIDILCNHETQVTNFFIYWLAQMIQYPEKKENSIMITLIGEQGCGKNTIVFLTKKIIGEKKFFECEDPSRDIWGSFNSKMKDCFLVNLDELSKKDVVEYIGKVKNLITSSTININQKGVDAFTIPSFHRFLLTTNTKDPLPTEKGDRRNMIIRCSDEKKGDFDYFNQFYEYCNDIDVLRTFYDYLKTYNIDPKFNMGANIPETEYHANLKEGNRDAVDLWLEDFTRYNENQEEVELLGQDAYGLFNCWKAENGIKYDINAVKLGMKISTLGIVGIHKGRHTKKGATKLFNIPQLKKHYGIGLLIELPKNANDEVDEED